jgi:hypothetical protein
VAGSTTRPLQLANLSSARSGSAACFAERLCLSGALDTHLFEGRLCLPVFGGYDLQAETLTGVWRGHSPAGWKKEKMKRGVGPERQSLSAKQAAEPHKTAPWQLDMRAAAGGAYTVFRVCATFDLWLPHDAAGALRQRATL